VNLEEQSHGARVNQSLLAALAHCDRHPAAQAGRITGSKSGKRWGFGLEFAELRNYVPGDEVRHINWRASSRAQKLMTKVYVEDRDARVLLMVDLMQHMYYGASKRLCSVMGVYLAAMLVGLLSARSYQVAIAWITNHQLRLLKPSHNRPQLVRNLRLLAQNHNVEVEKKHEPEIDSEVYRHIRPRLFAPYARAWLITSPYAAIPDHRFLRRLDVYDPRLLNGAGGFDMVSNRRESMAANRLPSVKPGEDSFANNLTLVECFAELRRRFSCGRL